MSQDLIGRALKTLRNGGRAESPLATGVRGADRVSAVYEEARSRSGLDEEGYGSTEEAARVAFAGSVLEDGRRALEEIARIGTRASLSETQIIGLEAIVRLTGRPSLLVQDGTYATPTEEWTEDFQVAQDAIEQVIMKVGRVNVPELGGAGYQGTGFLVADDLVMTNRHVAMKFSEPHQGGWRIRSGLNPNVDFKREHLRSVRLEHAIREIVLVHSDPLVDLALLRVVPINGSGTLLPQPVSLSTYEAGITSGRRVYVIGYPGYDDRNAANAIDQIFGTIFFVKRLAPGEVVSSQDGIQLAHDCSTLGGSSGSCVVDFGTHQVIGLHYSGEYLDLNRAVNVPRLHQDPLLVDCGLHFT